jgi:hypothetical protein
LYIGTKKNQETNVNKRFQAKNERESLFRISFLILKVAGRLDFEGFPIIIVNN